MSSWSIEQLERDFHRVANYGGDGCPLPEPEITGEKAVEHIGHLRRKRQPHDFNYDDEMVKAEHQAHVESWRQLWLNGAITPGELHQLVQLELLSSEEYEAFLLAS